jgi:WD40 repeat protein
VSVLEVAIGPGRASGTVVVRVLSSPVGEASAATELEADVLLARRAELEQVVLASSVASRRVLSEAERSVREVGQVLFAALLGAGEVAGRYRAAAAVAAERGQELRVVLRIDDPALAGLPWEAMYDEAAGGYVCRRDLLVRHVPVASAAAPLLVDPPLRILGIVSSPRGLAPLDVGKEQGLLEGALSRLASVGLAEVMWAPTAEWADLQDELLGGSWHAVHFIGHGDFDPDRDEGVLALTGADGRADLVEASRLVDLLRQARPMPRLVVLNSCSGAATGITDLFSGTAAALVRGGVSAVAAMQYEISDPAAVAFARGFYSAIAHGRGVDDAVSSGRVAIVGLSGRTLEWVTPVLYLRGHDSHLFTLPTQPPSDRQSAREDESTASADAPPARKLAAAQTVPSGGENAEADHQTRGEATERQAANQQAITSERAEATDIALQRMKELHERARPAPRLAEARAIPVGGPPAHVPSRVVRTLTGHTERVWDVAFSPDSTLLASAAGDKTVRFREVPNGRHVHTLTGHTNGVGGVAFSPDGRLLASAGFDQTVRLWEVVTGAEVRTLTGHAGQVRAVAFSPDGTLLASASWDTTVRLWEVATGANVRTLTGHTDHVHGVGFSPDGTLLASAASDRTVRLWEVATGANVRTLTGHTKWVYGVAFSPDGTLLASGGGDEVVRLWEVATGANVGTLTGHTKWVWGVAFSPDGTLLAAGGDDTTVRLWC